MSGITNFTVQDFGRDIRQGLESIGAGLNRLAEAQLARVEAGKAASDRIAAGIEEVVTLLKEEQKGQ